MAETLEIRIEVRNHKTTNFECTAHLEQQSKFLFRSRACGSIYLTNETCYLKPSLMKIAEYEDQQLSSKIKVSSLWFWLGKFWIDLSDMKSEA